MLAKVMCARRKVILRKILDSKPTKEVAKERKARTTRKVKDTKPKDGDTKKKSVCHKCHAVGHFAREMSEEERDT